MRRSPSIETELLEVQKRTPEVQPFVCEFRTAGAYGATQKRFALQLEFLPDAMAIEAEWQANRELVLALEDDRANEIARAPVDLFLREARFAHHFAADVCPAKNFATSTRPARAR